MLEYSSRYFQLTPDILIEYNYALDGEDSKMDATSLGMIDVITTANPYMKFFVVDDVVENANKNIGLDKYNFVIPTNKSETGFVNLMKEQGLDYTMTKPNGMSDTMSIQRFMFDTVGKNNVLVFDKIRLHFTSRKFMDTYDSLIFQAYVYNNIKQKICLMSFRLSKTDTLTLNQKPLLLNEKYYTTYVDVKILSTYKILQSYNNAVIGDEDYDYIYGNLKKYLEADNTRRRIMDNTPIMFTVYGVKHEIAKNGFNYYVTEALNKVSIPCRDRFDDLFVTISEATDGDYFIIQTKTTDGTSFSDYMRNYCGDNLNAFLILYELSLTEYYVPVNTASSIPEVRADITHREQYIVNVSTGYKDGYNTPDVEINEKMIDEPVLYRPIIKYNSECYKFMLEVDMKILNTTDNTTIVKKGSLIYDNPTRYGRRMNRINLTETPPVVNVYNRRSDGELGDMNSGTQIKIVNNSSGSSVKFETITQKIVSYVDVTNVVVQVDSISPYDITHIGD